MSAASDRRARVGAAVDRVWGESFLCTPCRLPEGDPDAHPVSDPDRPAFTFTGRFTANAEQEHARARASSLQTTRPFDTAAPTITVSRDVLTFAIGKNDVITRLDTGEKFAVTRVMDGDFRRKTLLLRKGPR